MAIFDAFGTCESKVVPLPSPLLEQCSKRTLTQASILKYAISNNLRIPFYGILSKNDNVQIILHNLLATSLKIPNTQYSSDGPEFYNDLYANVLTTLNQYPNFLMFIVPGKVHTFINHGYLYTTTEKSCYAPFFDFEAIISGCKIIELLPGDHYMSKEVNALPLQGLVSTVNSVCVNEWFDSKLCGVFESPKYFNTPASEKPTVKPSKKPTVKPSKKPTIIPSKKPTIIPSKKPTVKPSKKPTIIPSKMPTLIPL